MKQTFDRHPAIWAVCMLLLGAALTSPAIAGVKHEKKTPEELRDEYLAKVEPRSGMAESAGTVGSLWSPNGVLVDPAADYKARTVHDLLTISVSVQTTAAQTGTVNNSRAFATSSAITGLFGGISTANTSPLLAANSSNSLKGQGQTSSNTTFSTNLTGEVIAVFPNGNVVIEGHRQIFMNNQHEDVIIRGIARPGDIGPNNVVASSSLSNLEIELKGKGIISDSVRPPNPITRAVLWLFGF